MAGSLRTGRRFTFRDTPGLLARLAPARLAGVAGLALALSAGAALPARAQFYDNRAAGEANVRMERIETQMRALTGQIEQLGYQLKQLQDQLRRMQEDTEFRLNDLETKGAKPAKKTEAPATDPAGSAAALAPEQAAPAGVPAAAAAESTAFNTTSPATAGEPPQPLGSLPGSVAGLPAADDPAGPYGQDAGVGQPLDLTSLTRGAAKPERLAPDPAAAPAAATVASAPSAAGAGTARSAYDAAYSSMMRGDYPAAETGFRAFLGSYPRDRLAPDAQYWLGEALYAQSRYRDAADAFLKSYSDNPETAKAPDSLLKLGLSLEGLGEKDAACTTFGELLAKYPKAPRTLRDRARSEMQSAGCA